MLGRRALHGTVSRGLLAVLFVASATTLSPVALGAAKPAKNDKELARQAYDRGLEAHKRGDKKTAAEEFARADALSPSPVALQAALDSAIEADDVALGAELIERSKRAPAPPALAASVTAAHLRFNGRAGRVLVKCPSGSTCRAKIDGRTIETDKVAFATLGQHSVLVEVDGRAGPAKVVDLTAEETVEIVPDSTGGATAAAAGEPSPAQPFESWPTDDDRAPAKDRESSKRLSPIFFYGGVGVTVLLAGATTVFALNTSSAHDDFTKAGCARANFDPCARLQADGQSNQTLTNVFFVSTVVAGAATAVVGVFFTNWSAPMFGVDRNGATLGWRARF